MNELIMSIKREYWEYKAVVVGLPLILALLAFIAAVGVEMVIDRATHSSVAEILENLAQEELSESERRELRNELAEAKIEFESNPGGSFEPMAWFVGAAWLAGFYYLLGTLYNDRKDNSILFFKSLPVSEHYTVLVKLGFGTLGVVAIATVIGWGLAFLNLIFGLGDQLDQGLSLANASAYFIAPIQAALIGLLWGAPVFAYLLLASAAAKRSPFLLAIVPLLVLAFLEGVIFENINILNFFFSHMPFVVTSHMTENTAVSAFREFFINQGLSMLLGLIVAAVFISATIWHRNNRFEL